MRNNIIKFIFLAFGLMFISCKEDPELVVGHSLVNDPALGHKRTLKLFKDSTFMFADSSLNRGLDRDTIIKGKYTIKNDTIYFQDPFYYFKKGILTNGYFELLSPRPLKFELLKNNSQINSKIYTDTKSDFTFFTYTKEYFGKDLIGKNSSLNEDEILKVKDLIQATIEKNKAKFYSNFNENDYNKQCMVIINSKNEKEVQIHCISKKSSFTLDWKEQPLIVKDGGDYFFWITINLTKNEVTDLSVNGQA
ncbi:hypothetical protein ABH942_000324 [Flavobacterium sp. 28YEA47A]|uniref:hypothetical protein n=1 Tax=Flavobacterium sp. 28YEA47A TaxID=3156276 RepID=UPI0035153BAB